MSLPFATPLTLAFAWTALGGMQAGLGFGALPSLDVHARLFANFFGTVVTLWASVRLLRTEVAFGRFDAVGRFAFSLWMLLAIHAGATSLLCGFLVIEMSFGVAQVIPVGGGAHRRSRERSAVGPSRSAGGENLKAGSAHPPGQPSVGPG